MDIRRGVHDVTVNLISQALSVILVAASSVTLVLLFGTSDLRRIVTSEVSVPVWIVLLASLFVMTSGSVVFVAIRKSSVVRGRLDATRGNVALMRKRARLRPDDRIVRSTRFGRWIAGEVLESRTDFRQELDKAIMEEGADVRRIWNVSSLEDVQRLREVLQKYRGRANHSIRVYFNLPDHALPELLVIESVGASLSFPSNRSPRALDWMIRFNRRDLILVMRDYFDVLWDRAERMLDAGDVTPECERRLRWAEGRFGGESHSDPPM